MNGTLLGIGERTGNTPIEALMIEYMSLRGQQHGMNTLAITDMAEYFKWEFGHPIPDNYPLWVRLLTPPARAYMRTES